MQGANGQAALRLRGEVHAPEEGVEAGVGAEGIYFGSTLVLWLDTHRHSPSLNTNTSV